MAGHQDLPPAAERVDNAPERTVAEALSASALALAAHEMAIIGENDDNSETLTTLLATGTKLVSRLDTPPEAVHQWIEWVNSIKPDHQQLLASELRLFFLALVSRFSKLDAKTNQQPQANRIPKRLDEEYVDRTLQFHPDREVLPVIELPENAADMVVDYRKKGFLMRDMLQLFYGTRDVHPRCVMYISNLLADMVEAGNLIFDSHGKYNIVPAALVSEATDKDLPPEISLTPTEEPSLDEKIRRAGIGGGTGRPRGQVSSINGPQGAGDRRKGTKKAKKP